MSSSRRHLTLALSILALVGAEAGWCAAQVHSDTVRPLRVQDLFTVEELGDVRPSPDGNVVAVVVKRRRSPEESYQRSSFWSSVGEHDRDDIWLVDQNGKSPPKNLTNGSHTGTGFANPTWSPDGHRLALLSSSDGALIQLALWRRDDDVISPLAKDPVDASVSFLVDGQPVGPIAWLGPHQLVTVFLDPGGVSPDGASLMSGAVTAWSAAAKGRDPTGSAIDATRPRLPQLETVVRIDVESGMVDTIAVTQPFALTPVPGAYVGRIVDLSPDLRTGIWIAQSGDLLRQENERVTPSNAMGPMRLGIMALHRGSEIRWIDTFEPSLGQTSGAIALAGAWSPDSRRYAIIGNSHPPAEKIGVAILELSTGAITETRPRGQMPMAIEWCGPDCLAVKADARTVAPLTLAARPDWWSIDVRHLDRKPSNLTRRLKECPEKLVYSGGGSLYAVDDGALWRIQPQGQLITRMTDTADVRIDDLVAPTTRADSGILDLMFVGRKGVSHDFGTVRLSGLRASSRSVRFPTASARPLSYQWQTNSALFTSGDEDVGPVLWYSDSARSIPILTLNPHLKSIARAERRWIDYVGADGDSLLGLVLLPPGYKPGTRYPVVTWVYGGFVFQGKTLNSGADHFVNINQGSWLSLQLLTSRGYVVLLPSMPLRQSGGTRADPYLEISKGVMPAVTKVVDLGFGDPRRLALIGHSMGGYSVYSLVTQTNRFKAAIAIAGFTDLVSWYGAFMTSRRYGAAPHQYYYAPLLLENGFINASPYEDPARYFRNSPIFYVGHVATPLLLIHGDMDGIPIHQTEEFFTALHRLGRPARFIRYWGEGHNLRSPANIANMWDEIFEWLDRYLCRSGPPCPPN